MSTFDTKLESPSLLTNASLMILLTLLEQAGWSEKVWVWLDALWGLLPWIVHLNFNLLWNHNRNIPGIRSMTPSEILETGA